MKGKRWIWGGLAVVIIAAGICAFYFMSNTKSEQWIGVADSEPPNPEVQNAPIRVADVGEPAPPGTNEEDVDLTKTEPDSDISGEMTIGMAIDANVLIYERLREELETGKSLKASVETAYKKAFSAIVDSNLTTLLKVAILFWLGRPAGGGWSGLASPRWASSATTTPWPSGR